MGNVFQQGIHPLVVEAHAIHDGLTLRDAEQPGTRIAGLGPGSHRAHFNEAETHGGQAVDAGPIFVQASGQTYRIGKAQAHDFHRAIGHLAPGQARKPCGLEKRQTAQTEAVGLFCVQGKEDFAGELIKHNRAFYLKPRFFLSLLA